MRNFAAYPFAPFQGAVSSKPYNFGGAKSLMVALTVKWFEYNVGGVTVGSDIPNFTVIANLQQAATNVVPNTWPINSIYIDNEAVNFPVYVFFPDTGFAVSCPPNASGWFPVFTSARAAFVVAVGMTDFDIAAQATTTVFFTDAMRIPYLDPEQATAVDYRLASLTISFPGGGSGLNSVAPLPGGSGYNNGNLTVSGAGGAGGAVTGHIDAYGRFTSVDVTNPGAGYTGPPLITPTGGQTAPAAWSTFTGYTTGVLVQYGGKIYRFNGILLLPGPSNPPPPGNALWDDPNLTVNAAAVFNISLTAAAGGLTTQIQSTYAPSSLGDQARNYLDDIAAVGVFRQNLWGTPFNSGFIYLTSIDVHQFTASLGTTLWQIEDENNNVLQPFRNNNNGVGQLYEMNNGNIKLPATVNWRLRCTAFGIATSVGHGFAYTYAQY